MAPQTAHSVQPETARIGTLARGWIHQLVDTNSFLELDTIRVHHSSGPGMDRKRIDGDGVVSGIGRIDGRPVAVYAQDPSVMGGALGRVHAEKICRVLDAAERDRLPVVGLVASGGARIQEGVDSLSGYGEVFRRTVALSGKVPQLTVAMSTCAGGAVYQPALTDLVVMIRNQSRMFITGPSIVEAVTFEQVSADELGGWQVHARQSGLCGIVANDVSDAFDRVRTLLSYLDPGRRSVARVRDPEFALPPQPVPLDPRKVYDVRDVVRGIVDAGSLCELYREYARNIYTAFARIEGVPVGIIANQPRRLGGVLDSSASRKGARFLRLCNSFGIPVVTLVDCPGYLPGRRAEADGITVHGAKLLHAYCEATVPRYTVVMRKSYGGAYIVLGSRSIGASAVWSWPDAEIGVMGARGAVNLLHRRELAAASDPDAARDRLETDYRNRILDPSEAARKGQVDAIICPTDTRRVLALALSHSEVTPSHTPAFPF
ncbi:MAG: acyl-CoA carboxylase subunit beta [Candidatus Dadabacteria bacterium]|nr:MAG: acyl-CoA carboxylase subunit beta [Candidatus Dadabacteria bacterium]